MRNWSWTLWVEIATAYASARIVLVALARLLK